MSGKSLQLQNYRDLSFCILIERFNINLVFAGLVLVVRQWLRLSFNVSFNSLTSPIFGKHSKSGTLAQADENLYIYYYYRYSTPNYMRTYTINTCLFLLLVCNLSCKKTKEYVSDGTLLSKVIYTEKYNGITSTSTLQYSYNSITSWYQ